MWDKEVDNTCEAYNHKEQTPENSDDERIQVHERFDIILKIYFTVFVVETFRSILMLVALITKRVLLAKIYQYLALNDCLAFAALIILHVYRFQPSGKACSGDYSRENGSSEEDLDALADGPSGHKVLIRRGRYLLGLVIWVWVGSIGICLITIIA